MEGFHPDLAARIKHALTAATASTNPMGMEEIMPLEVRNFIVEYYENKARLEQICKSMEQVLEKWDVRPRPANVAPSLDAALTWPYRCAEELEKLQEVVSNGSSALNEVLIATQVAYSDLAALEREHLVKLYQTVIEKVFRGYLVNEVPGIERNIKATNEAAIALSRALENAEGRPTASNKEALVTAESNFEFALIKMHQYVSNFPDRKKEFARGAIQFAKEMREHYSRLHHSVNTTLGLLNEKLSAAEHEEEDGSARGNNGKDR